MRPILGAWAVPLLAIISFAASDPSVLTLSPRVQPSNTGLAEQSVVDWMHKQPVIHDKLNSTIRRAKAAEAERQDWAKEADLKDAVAPPSPSASALLQSLARADAKSRQPAPQALPVVKDTPSSKCHTLEGCAELPVSFHVADPANRADEAIAALVRPLLVLQWAKGAELRIAQAAGSGDRLFMIELPDRQDVSLGVLASAEPDGKVEVWLSGRPSPKDVFASERQRVLASARTEP